MRHWHNTNTVDVLFFAGTYCRGQLSPKQFAGYTNSRYKHWMRHRLNIFKLAGINNRGDHVTAKTGKINTQRNILLIQYTQAPSN